MEKKELEETQFYIQGILRTIERGDIGKVATSISSHLTRQTHDKLKEKGLGFLISKEAEEPTKPHISYIAGKISKLMEDRLTEAEQLKSIQNFAAKVEVYLTDCLEGEKQYSEAKIEEFYKEQK